MAPSPAQVLGAVKASGVRYVLEDGWDDPAIAAHQGTFDPQYVILHHTANDGAKGNEPSLAWVKHPGKLAPIRACHFLVGRDGLVHVIYSLACYHAGMGGPGKWGDGPYIGKDVMNSHAYGIEIESKGTSLEVTKDGGTNGITPAQLKATAALAGALLDLVGRAPECAINHRTWAPGRKSDTLMSDLSWQRLIRASKATGGAGAGAAVPPAKPAIVWVRDIKFHSVGSDVNHFLAHVRPEGTAQLATSAAHGWNAVIDYPVWTKIRRSQLARPLLWGERVRGVIGPKTWRMVTGHA